MKPAGPLLVALALPLVAVCVAAAGPLSGAFDPRGFPAALAASGDLIAETAASSTPRISGAEARAAARAYLRTATAASAAAPPAGTSAAPAGIAGLFDPPACRMVDEWITRWGGTFSDFPGIGIDGETFTRCTPIVARIAHVAQEQFLNDCGQTVQEVNLDFELEHEGELWFSADGSRAAVLVHRFNGRQRSLNLRRADGFYFAGRTGCELSDRHAFAGARPTQLSSGLLHLFQPAGVDGLQIHYQPPALDEPMLLNAVAISFSIPPADETALGLALSLDALRALRDGRALIRELTWKNPTPSGADHVFNRLRFTLTADAGPGILAVTPDDGLMAFGPDDQGRFAPSSKRYTLRNTGASTIDFAVAGSKNWLDAAPGSGSLRPGAEAAVTISLNDNAQTLTKPDRDTVRFTNQTSGRGDTTRSVELGRRERWRITVDGWDTLTFGDAVLGGGLRARWRIVLELNVEGGKLREGHGSAAFGRHETYSTPPGVYDCVPLAGSHLDAGLTRHPTPYIRQSAFPVTGSVAGRSAKLLFAPGNYYVLGYHCVMDIDRVLEAFAARNLPIRPEDRVRSSRTDVSAKDVRQLPSALTVQLNDGWTRSVGRSSSFDAHQIRVERLK